MPQGLPLLATNYSFGKHSTKVCRIVKKVPLRRRLLTRLSRTSISNSPTGALMKLLFVILFASFSCFANDFLEVAGKKYQINLQEVQCLNWDGSPDSVNVDQILFNSFASATCGFASINNAAINCSKIDDRFLLRNYIASRVREKNYCNCQVGPNACISFCSKVLQSEECSTLCSGSCGIVYPQK